MSIKCPHCTNEIGFEYTAKVADESRMAYTLHVMPGELMTAQTIGGSLSAMGDLMVAAGKSMEVPTVALVEGVDPIEGEPGSLKIRLLIARGPNVAERKKRMKKAAT